MNNDYDDTVGICYGFQVLRVCESPNIPFTLLYERFTEGIIIAIIIS